MTEDLMPYLTNNLNVLLQGDHGTGKTSMIMDVARRAGVKVKVFNAATMDPYTELVGVPKFSTDEQGREVLVSVRPRQVDDAELIFIDELNRAGDPKITNAVFEMIQFRTINGEPLPKLRCVWAAINPPDSKHNQYDVQPLDPALVDRFDVTIEVPVEINRTYFMKTFGPKVANALITWWNGISDKRENYVSPRRLEILGKVFLALHTENSLRDAMPPGKFEVRKLYELLSEATLTPEQVRQREAARKAQQERLTGQRGGSGTVADQKLVDDLILKATSLQESAIRRYGPAAVAATLKNPKLPDPARAKIVAAISTQISEDDTVGRWSVAYNNLTKDEFKRIVSSWSSSKRYTMKRTVRSNRNILTHEDVILNS